MADNLINIYKQRLEVMSIVCVQTSSFYNTCKNVIMCLSLLISSVLAILNSATENLNDLKLPNIILNSFLVFLIGISNQLKFSELNEKFHKLFNSFSKLEHSIDRLNNNLDTPMSSEEINGIITKYDDLMETVDNIPSFIKKRVRKQYIHKHLPFFLNHVNEAEKQEFIKANSISASIQISAQPSDLETNAII